MNGNDKTPIISNDAYNRSLIHEETAPDDINLGEMAALYSIDSLELREPTDAEKAFFTRLTAERLQPQDDVNAPFLTKIHFQAEQLQVTGSEYLPAQPLNNVNDNEAHRFPGILNLDDINYEPPEWVWEGFIPKGKVTLIAGEQGVGKSTLLVNIVSVITQYGYNVIYQNAEDDPASTTKLRFIQSGANQKHVFIIDDSTSYLGIDDARWEDAIAKLKPLLVIIDPIQAFLNSTVDMNKANVVREKMMHLTRLAKNYNCGIIVVCHLTKANYSKVLSRILGSTDFSAVARQVLAVGSNPDNPLDRAMVVIKSNIGQPGASYGYTIDGNGFRWTGPSVLTEDAMFSSNNYKKANGGSKQEAAEKLIQMCVSQGITDGNSIWEMAQSQGISLSTFRRAKDNLGINPGSGNKNVPWVLPVGLYSESAQDNMDI